METEIFTEHLEGAARILRNGGLVAVPTETVYGLAGNGLDAGAVAQIYEVKGRPAIKPLSLMVPGVEAMEKYCHDIPDTAYLLAEAYWPGPLTIVLPANPEIPEIVRAGGDTVGLRCPAHDQTLELLRLAQVPFAAPSANPSGAPSPKTAEEVRNYFDGKIDGIVDGGPCDLGTESTLISLCSVPYRIFREAALSRRDIEETLRKGMKILGITGPSGSGKTTVLELLREQGAFIIDCDAVYHELLSSCGEMLSEIEREFPGTVQNGELDRKALGRIVFADERRLLTLNRITHGYVVEETDRRLREATMSGYRCAAIDALYVLESGLVGLCTATIGVVADREVCIARIMKRDGIDRSYAEARIDAQKNAAYYEDNCTYTLINNASNEELIHQCNTLLKEIL